MYCHLPPSQLTVCFTVFSLNVFIEPDLPLATPVSSSYLDGSTGKAYTDFGSVSALLHGLPKQNSHYSISTQPASPIEEAANDQHQHGLEEDIRDPLHQTPGPIVVTPQSTAAAGAATAQPQLQHVHSGLFDAPNPVLHQISVGSSEYVTSTSNPQANVAVAVAESDTRRHDQAFPPKAATKQQQNSKCCVIL
jgi:hypothetical protein